MERPSGTPEAGPSPERSYVVGGSRHPTRVPVDAGSRLQAPIVLAHGLFGFNHIGLGRLTVATYFRGIPQWLRASGNRVAVTRAPAIAGVAQRAQCLGDRIEAAFPGEPVHVIGHSMGGLDARLLLAEPS